MKRWLQKMSRKQKTGRIILYCVIGLVYLLAFFIICICNWAMKTFEVSIDSILFTLSSPIKGTNTDVVKDAVKYCLPRLVFVIFVYVIICIIDYKRKNSLVISVKLKKKTLSLNASRFMRVCASFCCIIALFLSVVYIDKNYGVVDYLKLRSEATEIYENYYVDPSKAEIKLLEENSGKNLIHIYLESMEVTAASLSDGGIQDDNYIPNLTNLALNNISFSNNNQLGGFQNTVGTHWTFASLLAQTSGIPFSFPTGRNTLSERSTIAKSMTNLGDVLNSFGYTQKFLCGSDGDFAGRKTYFEQHGNYEVLDYYKCVEKGYIPEDHYVFWGYEDSYLFDIAKKEIELLASSDKPFNFTMLTVDTHHPSGYTCDLCGDDYDLELGNVYACSDKQVYEFVEWCKTQDFFDDTIIIITGDHPFMNNTLVEENIRANGYTRAMYNCFINCGSSDDYSTNNRTFTPMDIFPTTLSALGFTWNGDRLGLGTNLFSNSKTLAEELGFETLNTELSKYSKYYVENFY